MNEEEIASALASQEQNPEGMPPPEEEMPEEEMVEGAMPEEMEQEPEQEGGEAEELGRQILPPEIQEKMQLGAEALFYTGLQVAMNKTGVKYIRPILLKGNIQDAGIFVMDQAIKNHKQKGLEITSPMVVVASYFIAQLCASLAGDLGVKADKQKVNAATLGIIDWHFGDLYGGKKANDRSKKVSLKEREAAELSAAAARQGPPPAPPQQGMIEQGPPPTEAPQGGMM